MSSGDLTYDGQLKVSWVATIGSIAGPTVAELTAGTDISSDITPDGLTTGFDTASVDNSALNSTFNTSLVGRSTPQLSITFKMFYSDGTDRPARTTLVRGASGYLVVRRNKASSGAFIATDKVEVYPVQCGKPSPANAAANEVQKATVALFPTADPNTSSVVAA